MSFRYEFAPDARSQWRELDIELQELVLDQLEEMLPEAERAGSNVIHRIVVSDRSNVRHFVFLRASVDAERQVLIAIGVTQFSQEQPPGKAP